MKNNPILLIAGDPYSIFFEILFKALKKKKYKSPFILICCKTVLSNQMRIFDFKKRIKILKINEINKNSLNTEYLNIIDVKFNKSSNKNFSNLDLRHYINKSFDVAFKLIRNGLTNKLINGPINKKIFLDKKFLGVTEFVSSKFRSNKTAMLIYNKDLSVCPITTHLPISQVSKKISKKLISEKIEIINDFFRHYLKKQAKIAVTGLNPHCESILKYNKDELIIPSVIKDKQKRKMNITGPFSADTIFLKKNRKKFNVIIGMYHDQVIGPFKSIYEYNAINITIGLPFLRVTPDHGPNFKMFGKNKSNPLSLIKAIEFLDNR